MRSGAGEWPRNRWDHKDLVGAELGAVVSRLTTVNVGRCQLPGGAKVNADKFALRTEGYVGCWFSAAHPTAPFPIPPATPLTKREELSFRSVLALPKASMAGLASMI